MAAEVLLCSPWPDRPTVAGCCLHTKQLACGAVTSGGPSEEIYMGASAQEDNRRQRYTVSTSVAASSHRTQSSRTHADGSSSSNGLFNEKRGEPDGSPLSRSLDAKRV